MSLQPKCDMQVPLLVKIQTIEVENLDFKTPGSKSKLVTYVDGTSRFLFVGYTSGTVYVFSRDTHQFLFIIPFKGGKVCGISCTEDETDVAVGSLRGRVALYRLSSSESTGDYASSHHLSSPVPVSVKQLYTVSHHNNNEITEMQWSPNGRYLFIGDNQGLISQVDVGSLEEFPRPPPSRVILQVQSRVLQLDCIFPYLAVNTLSGVFLCDIENEDFTRIQFPNRNSILRATGVSLVVSPDVGKAGDAPSISLFVAASNSHSLLRFGVQGNLLENREINEGNTLNQKEVLLFDPKNSADFKSNINAHPEFKPSFGKLFTTDDGYIISASNHQIMVIDPNRTGIDTVFWNDEFRRISSLKVLSNYLFIWETGKLHVVALTYFRPYGEQLYSANLHSVLENWVKYALLTIGCKKEDEDIPPDQEGQDHQESETNETNNVDEELREDLYSKKSRELFRLVMSSSSSTLDDDFSNFVLSRVPPSIKDNLLKELDQQKEEVDDLDSFPASTSEQPRNLEKDDIIEPNPIRDALQKLTDSIENITDGNGEDTEKFYIFYKNLWEVLTDFYQEIEAQLPFNVQNTDEDSVIFKQSLLQNKISMDNLIQSIIWFLKQSSLKLAELELLSSEFPGSTFKTLQIRMQGIINKLNSSQTQVGEFIKLMETKMKWEREGKKDEEEDEDDVDQSSFLPQPQLFSNYADQSSVIRWFTDFKIPTSHIQVDAYLAEIFLLLAPFIRWTCLDDLTDLIQNVYRRRFFTWLSLLTASKEYGTFPYEQRLSDCLVDKIQGNRIQEIITCVYQHLLKPLQSNPTSRRQSQGDVNDSNSYSDSPISDSDYASADIQVLNVPTTQVAANNLHHFATLVHLKSMSKNSKSKIISALITSFPFNNRNEEEIRRKLRDICEENPMLVEMYRKACLTDGNSQKLCSCGLAEFYGMPRLFVIPKTQRVVEESILEILMEYKDSEGMKRAFRFAMQRLLFDKYFQMLEDIQPAFLDDKLKLAIVLRSGQCHLLQNYFPFNLTRLEMMIEFYEKVFENPKGKDKCLGCGKLLKIFPNVRIISWDCIGLWILGNSSAPLSLEGDAGDQLIATVASSQTLNKPGIFSLRFYKLLANAGKDLNEIEESFDPGRKYTDIREGPSRFNFNSVMSNRSICAALH